MKTYLVISADEVPLIIEALQSSQHKKVRQLGHLLVESVDGNTCELEIVGPDDYELDNGE